MIRQSGYPISKLAIRIGYTRQHFYNLFEKRKISYELIERIGKVINVNFANELKDFEKHTKSKEETNFTDTDIDYKELYYALLEQQNKLLKENYNLLKKINSKT